MMSISWIYIFAMVSHIENIPIQLNLYWHTNTFIKFLFDLGPGYLSGFCISGVNMEKKIFKQLILFPHKCLQCLRMISLKYETRSEVDFKQMWLGFCYCTDKKMDQIVDIRILLYSVYSLIVIFICYDYKSGRYFFDVICRYRQWNQDTKIFFFVKTMLLWLFQSLDWSQLKTMGILRSLIENIARMTFFPQKKNYIHCLNFADGYICLNVACNVQNAYLLVVIFQ